MTNKVMLLLGGAYHDFDGFKKMAVPLLTKAGYEVAPTFDNDDLKKLDDSYAAAVIYTSFGGVTDGDVNFGNDLNIDQVRALKEYVSGGGGLLAVHSATVMSESGGELHHLFGGRFVEHPPMFYFSILPMRISHPITSGVGAFTVYDEFYIQDVTEDSTVLMTAVDRGVCHPMVWVRDEGKGRVAYVEPGHDKNAWGVPEVEKLTVQALAWVRSRANHR